MGLELDSNLFKLNHVSISAITELFVSLVFTCHFVENINFFNGTLYPNFAVCMDKVVGIIAETRRKIDVYLIYIVKISFLWAIFLIFLN